MTVVVLCHLQRFCHCFERSTTCDEASVSPSHVVGDASLFYSEFLLLLHSIICRYFSRFYIFVLTDIMCCIISVHCVLRVVNSMTGNDMASRE